MEGMPDKTSVLNRVAIPRNVFGCRVTYKAVKIPMGIEKTIEIIRRIKVPWIAWEIPPPAWPKIVGNFVKKSQLIE